MNSSSLFSCSSLSNTKDNGVISSLSRLRLWARAGQLLMSCHASPWYLHSYSFFPCFFSISLSDFHLSWPASATHSRVEPVHSMFCTAPIAISHNWEISDLEKAITSFTSLNAFPCKCQDALSRRTQENKFCSFWDKWTVAELLWLGFCLSDLFFSPQTLKKIKKF